MQSGKWWEGHPSRGGFTHAMTHGDPDRGGRHGDEGLTIGREGLGPVFSFMDEARRANRPFLLWYAPFMPHAPHTPPPEILERYESIAPSPAVARYWAMCEWFDSTCGELLGYLDRHQLAEDTLVVYVSDNGWIQDPERPNRYAKPTRSKRSPYDGGVRTPIMLRWRGTIDPELDEATPVSAVDLVPTILGTCGMGPTAAMPGIDLLDTGARTSRGAIFGEVYAHDVADVEDPTRSLQYRWLVRDSWKLIVPHPPGLPEAKIELFDLRTDPAERNDLGPARPVRVAELRALLDAWWPGPG
jgi:arylsulfatase A-like enzyme